MQHRHARDRRVRLQRDGVDGVVCANHQRYVCVREVVVDFVHFEYNWWWWLASLLKDGEGGIEIRTIVWNGSLGKEDIALAWHSARYGVDGESDVDALGA